MMLFKVGLTILLARAAWSDWRTRRVPHPLMWLLLVVGVGATVLTRHWPVTGAAILAVVFSSLPFVSASVRRGVSGLLIISGWLIPDPGQAIACSLIGVFWLAYEMGAIGGIGGADSTIAIGLLALFPTPIFASVLLVAWVGLSVISLVIRRLRPDNSLARNVPLVLALAFAGIGYVWAGPFTVG